MAHCYKTFFAVICQWRALIKSVSHVAGMSNLSVKIWLFVIQNDTKQSGYQHFSVRKKFFFQDSGISVKALTIFFTIFC